MRKLTEEEKRILQEKIHEAGLDKKRRGTGKIELTDDNKEEMKKMIARAERERLGLLDKHVHSRSKKKKEASEEETEE